MLIINIGHNPLRKSSEENQDVARGRGGGEIQFHSPPCTSLTPAICFATPVLLCVLQIPFNYIAHALSTEITDGALIKLLFCSTCSKGHITLTEGCMFLSVQNNMR